METEDGYILKIHHIKANAKSSKKQQVVFFMHGMFATSADFIILGSDKAFRI